MSVAEPFPAPDDDTAYDARMIEAKWQARWAAAGCFKADATAPGRKFFNFDGGPFPNGPLHMGHVRTFTLGDVMARYRRMRGDSLLYCFEFDAFGLPNELAANALGVTPERLTRDNIERMRRQMVQLGLSYDWDHVVTTCDPAYYRWTQWLFLKLREHGLVDRRLADLNWCPNCNTTLAHMQVEHGRCWRCDTEVESRRMTQWFVAISRYSAQLSDSLDQADGLGARVRNILHGFMGRTDGREIAFAIDGHDGRTLRAFQREEWRDAAAAFVAVAPGHPALSGLLPDDQAHDLPRMQRRRRAERDDAAMYGGFATGLEAVHSDTGLRLPVFVAHYVDPAFADGVELGCPERDPRASRFAAQHGISCAEPRHGAPLTGRAVTHYRVRDWLVSRQRAWGTPIPIVHCARCGEVAVPEAELPVHLPPLTPNMPPGGLANVPEFVATTCPACGHQAQRETDTLDCYFDVVWCFLACASGLRADFRFAPEDFADWMPVDWFHNGLDSLFYMHLYRFLGLALHDIGLLPEPEPMRHYVGHDAVLLDGHKMSKHHGNVVSPDEVINKVGADVLRVLVIWAANPLKSVEWSDAGLQRARRLLSDTWTLVAGLAEPLRSLPARDRGEAASLPLDRATARAVRRVAEFIERYQYAGCLHEIQTLLSRLDKEARRWPELDGPGREAVGNAVRCLIKLLAPFAPHMAEELWQRIGQAGLIARAPWPVASGERR